MAVKQQNTDVLETVALPLYVGRVEEGNKGLVFSSLVDIFFNL